MTPIPRLLQIRFIKTIQYVYICIYCIKNSEVGFLGVKINTETGVVCETPGGSDLLIFGGL